MIIEQKLYLCVLGNVMYFDTSRLSLSPTNTVTIRFPRWVSAQDACLTFYYYMHGQDTSTLMLYYDDGKAVSAAMHIWHQTFDQGDLWRNESFTMTNLMPNALLFSASTSVDNGVSDIIVDDISITEGPCDVPTSKSKMEFKEQVYS